MREMKNADVMWIRKVADLIKAVFNQTPKNQISLQRSPKILKTLQNFSLLLIHRRFIFNGDLEYPFISQLSGVNLIKI